MLLTLAAILVVAALVETCLGFGAVVLSVALGSYVMPVEVLLPTLVCLNMPLSAYVALRERRAIDRALLVRLLGFMGLGLPLGLAVFVTWGPGRLLPFLGAGLALLAGLELLKAARTRPAVAPAGPDAIGLALPDPLPIPLPGPLRDGLLLAAGVVHGLYSSGGPLAVYVASRQLPDKGALRGTLAAAWLVLAGCLLVAYAASGALTATALGRAALLAPALLAGMALGEWAHGRLPAPAFRFLVRLGILAVGVSLVFRA